MTDSEVYAGSTILGAMSGMRAVAGLALVSQVTHSGLLPLDDSRFQFLRHPASAQGTFLASLGELVADKLPSTPPRIQLFPLLTRAASGGFSGATYAAAKKRSIFIGAALGTAAAIGTAYGAYFLRRFLSQKLSVPDTVVAVAEDAAMIACGSVIIEKLHQTRDLRA